MILPLHESNRQPRDTLRAAYKTAGFSAGGDFDRIRGDAGRCRRSGGSLRRAIARRCRRWRDGMVCRRANCLTGSGWPARGALASLIVVSWSIQ